MVLDVWEGYFIYQMWDEANDKSHLYKQTYTIASDDTVAFSGDPVEVEPAFIKKGTVEVVASKITTVSGSDAAATKLLADLRANNPLVATIEATRNAHLIVMDLTTIGRPSQHEGQTKFLLETAGLKAAAPTLITKPVHITQSFDGHVDAGKKPVAIGTFIGSVNVDNGDGTITLRTVASLWEADFPDELDALQADRANMGGSYEITYDPISATRDGNIVRIPVYAFTGGAILLKSAAAHPESQLLVAEHLRDQRAPTTATGTPRATSVPNTKGGRSMKYPPIPVEHETMVDLLISQASSKAVTDAIQPIIAERDRLGAERGQFEDKIKLLEPELVATKESLVKATNDLAAATVKVEGLTTELTTVQAQLVVFTEAKAVADHKTALDAKWAELKTEFGLEDSMREARAALLEKLVAGKDQMSTVEMKQLVGGGKIVPITGPPLVGLFAASGDGTDRSTVGDPEVLKQTLPASVAGARKQIQYR